MRATCTEGLPGPRLFANILTYHNKPEGWLLSPHLPDEQNEAGVSCLGLQNRTSLQIQVSWHLPSSHCLDKENIRNEKQALNFFFCFLGISHNVYSGRAQKCWWEWILGTHFNYLLFSLQTQIIKIFWSIQSGKLPNLSSLPKGKKKDLEWILYLIVYNWIGIWTNHPSGFYLFLWCG